MLDHSSQAYRMAAWAFNTCYFDTRKNTFQQNLQNRSSTHNWASYVQLVSESLSFSRPAMLFNVVPRAVLLPLPSTRRCLLGANLFVFNIDLFKVDIQCTSRQRRAGSMRSDRRYSLNQAAFEFDHSVYTALRPWLKRDSPEPSIEGSGTVYIRWSSSIECRWRYSPMAILCHHSIDMILWCCSCLSNPGQKSVQKLVGLNTSLLQF